MGIRADALVQDLKDLYDELGKERDAANSEVTDLEEEVNHLKDDIQELVLANAQLKEEVQGMHEDAAGESI